MTASLLQLFHSACRSCYCLTPCHLMPLFLVLLKLSLISTVSGLKCVQCVSFQTQSCLHGSLTSTPCVGSDAGSTYCLKSVGTRIVDHGHLVFRTCSKTLQTNCTFTEIEGDMYTICHHSCAHDDCNMATSIRFSIAVLIFICILTERNFV